MAARPRGHPSLFSSQRSPPARLSTQSAHNAPASFLNTHLPISAAVTAFRRTERLIQTLKQLQACIPAPAEILVHVDGGNTAVIEVVREVCPEARVLQSQALLGPGGSRNRLVAESAHDWIASFDDDAWPLSLDYFKTVAELAASHPNAAIFGASSLVEEWQWPGTHQVAVYHGYASVFNKTWFTRTEGFVPLPFAYCMEEQDLSLKLHALGGMVLQSPELRVEHDADLPGNTTAFHRQALANTALFHFLRYPLVLLPVALVQLAKRCFWLLRVCPGAIVPGLLSIPQHLWTQRRHRKTVPPQVLQDWMRLRRHPRVLAAIPNALSE